MLTVPQTCMHIYGMVIRTNSNSRCTNGHVKCAIWDACTISALSNVNEFMFIYRCTKLFSILNGTSGDVSLQQDWVQLRLVLRGYYILFCVKKLYVYIFRVIGFLLTLDILFCCVSVLQDAHKTEESLG